MSDSLLSGVAKSGSFKDLGWCDNPQISGRQDAKLIIVPTHMFISVKQQSCGLHSIYTFEKEVHFMGFNYQPVVLLSDSDQPRG